MISNPNAIWDILTTTDIIGDTTTGIMIIPIIIQKIKKVNPSSQQIKLFKSPAAPAHLGMPYSDVLWNQKNSLNFNFSRVRRNRMICAGFIITLELFKSDANETP